MKRYTLAAGAIFTCFLASFLLVEAFEIPIVHDPAPWLQKADLWAGMIGVGLLIADVALPIPSSLVMIAHGALFGMVGGTALSLIGSTGASMVGFALGRRAGPLIVQHVPPEEHARATAYLERWGVLALIVSRPVPLLAETVAILAGASSVGWGRALLAAIVGSLPSSLVYAIAGATVAQLDYGPLIAAILVPMAGGVWVVGHALKRQ